MATFQLREPPSTSADNDAPTNNRKLIFFKHPGYSDGFGDILGLYARDNADGGLHARTALLACQIVACNAWDGYLTATRDGERLQIQDGTILTAKKYYFYVPAPAGEGSAVYKYPVCPSFQHWTFPHDELPSFWRGQEFTVPTQPPTDAPAPSSVSSAVVHRDGACALSRDLDYLERAHLCPRSETAWFATNRMNSYSSSRTMAGDLITDDMANAIALRSDIHRAFDDCKFVFVRKHNRWVAHFLENTRKLGRSFHNVPVDVNASVQPEFMLARFACAIFPFLKFFMYQGPDRVVKVEKESNSEDKVIKALGPNEFDQLSKTGRGRSNSPKKRKPSQPLPPITETKRQRTSDESPAGVYETGSNAGESFCSATSTSLPHSTSSLRPPPDMTSEDEDLSIPPMQELGKAASSSSLLNKSEDERLSALRMQELRKRRPNNPDLFCCDYNFAEYANSHGIPGKREYGGAHLCFRCHGAETDPMEDVPDPDEPNVMGVK